MCARTVRVSRVCGRLSIGARQRRGRAVEARQGSGFLEAVRCMASIRAHFPPSKEPHHTLYSLDNRGETGTESCHPSVVRSRSCVSDSKLDRFRDDLPVIWKRTINMVYVKDKPTDVVRIGAASREVRRAALFRTGRTVRTDRTRSPNRRRDDCAVQQ